MSPRVVLVTGVSRDLGSRLAARLAEQQGIDRVIGVDTVPPRGEVRQALGRTEFVRADIRNPLIAKVVTQFAVDTVVHLGPLATPMRAGGRSSMKELNVLGAMQLLAACQKAPAVRRLVVRSTAAVYGSSPRDPAMFSEETEPKALPRSGYAKDAVEVEGYVRGFGRRRPDVAITMLRFTNVIGPRIDSPLVSYFSLPMIPTVLGFDPRLQLLHEDDALEVLRLACVGDTQGTFNVGGPGVLLLSQAIRRAGRVPVPFPRGAVRLMARFARQSGMIDFSPEQLSALLYGRVVDLTRLVDEFGYRPRHTTVEAFDDFARGRNLTSPLSPVTVRAVERLVLDRLTSAGPVDA